MPRTLEYHRASMFVAALLACGNCVYSRSEAKPWLSVVLAVIAALFPILVAVDWGYKRDGGRADAARIKASLIAAEWKRATERPPASNAQSESDAIKADVDRNRHGTA